MSVKTPRYEVVKTKGDMIWMKIYLTPEARLRSRSRLFPDLFLPDLWNGEKLIYDTPWGRLSSFIFDLQCWMRGWWMAVSVSISEEES